MKQTFDNMPEAVSFYRRQEKRLKIKLLLENDPAKRDDLEKRILETKERRASLQIIEKRLDHGCTRGTIATR